MGWLRLMIRLPAVLAWLAWGWWRASPAFQRRSQADQQAHVRHWAAAMLRAMGVTVRVRGVLPAQGPWLMVCNHVSWLDILVLHSMGYCRFVAKSEVHHWPVVGPMATAAGTLYIERASRRDAMRVVHDMVSALRRGDCLAVFPEGTTSNGLELLPFHANLVQAALSAPCPVLPVALRYTDGTTGHTSQAARYTGDDTLAGSLAGVLRAQSLQVSVHMGALLHAEPQHRRALCHNLQQQVESLFKGLHG